MTLIQRRVNVDATLSCTHWGETSKQLLYFDKSNEQESWNYFLCVIFQRKHARVGIEEIKFLFVDFIDMLTQAKHSQT